jgi:hypothetical protein
LLLNFLQSEKNLEIFLRADTRIRTYLHANENLQQEVEFKARFKYITILVPRNPQRFIPTEREPVELFVPEEASAADIALSLSSDLPSSVLDCGTWCLFTLNGERLGPPGPGDKMKSPLWTTLSEMSLNVSWSLLSHLFSSLQFKILTSFANCFPFFLSRITLSSGSRILAFTDFLQTIQSNPKRTRMSTSPERLVTSRRSSVGGWESVRKRAEVSEEKVTAKVGDLFSFESKVLFHNLVHLEANIVATFFTLSS